MLCSVCKKNLAVVFINKLDKDGKSTGETTGLCIECAKKQGIDPLANIMKEMSNMNEEDFENMSNQFDSMMGAIEGSNELGGLDDDDDLDKPNSIGNIFGNILPFAKNKKDDLPIKIREKYFDLLPSNENKMYLIDAFIFEQNATALCISAGSTDLTISGSGTTRLDKALITPTSLTASSALIS